MNFKLKTPNTKTNSLILAYVTLSDGSRFVYSTGQKIPVQLWDKNFQLPKRTKSQKDQMIVNAVNFRLDKIKSAYMELNFRYKTEGTLLTKDLLRYEFDILFKAAKRIESPKDFDSCFEDYYQFKIKEGKWSRSTATRYRMILKLLKEYEKFYKPIVIEEIDENWMADFKHYCEQKKSHQVNTVARNLGLLKSFLNYCLKREYMSNSKFKEMPVRREITHQIALSKDEIDLIASLDLTNSPRLERVRDVFLLGCYSGMRYSDFKRIRPSNITNEMIVIREVKDKTKFLQIPITRKIWAILNKYDMILPVISEQKFRDYLKDVFKLAGFTSMFIKSTKIGKNVFEQEVPMYELMSTHTARRSFITIMLNNGVPAKAIMKITGHRSINNFQLYYKPSNEVIKGFMDKVWQ